MASNWALVIGINQYEFLQPLLYAKCDAQLMQDFLGKEVSCERIFFFSDDSPDINGKSTRPNRANLRRVLLELFEQTNPPKMGAGDNFWFFFSGHGMRYNDRDYLMPCDGNPRDIEETAIPINFVTERLRRCGADNVILILDACRNQGKRGEGIGRQTEEMARSTGIISIFSCSPNEYSYEIDALQQGAFTHALLEGLGIRGQCATVERLNQYLSFQVPKLVTQYKKARQTPYMITEPVNKSHLILVPRYATLADIATLKNDAYQAEVNFQRELAQQLWIRVLAAASGQDMEAITALQRIVQIRPSFSPLKSANPSPRVNSGNKSPTTTTNFFQRIFQQARRSILQQKILIVRAAVVLVFVLVVYYQIHYFFNSPATDTQPIASSSPTNSTLPSKPKQPTPVPSDSDLPFQKGVDYTRLRDLLAAGNWKGADNETYKVMLKVVGGNEGHEITYSQQLNFPCTDLRTIDSLWVEYSNGRFGFSVQNKIYLGVGGKPGGNNIDAWNKLGDRVGWKLYGNKLNNARGDLVKRYSIRAEYWYGTYAPVGFFPMDVWMFPSGALASRLVKCNL